MQAIKHNLVNHWGAASADPLALDLTSPTPVVDLHSFSLPMAKLAIQRVLWLVQRPEAAYPGELITDISKELVVMTG